MQLNVLPFWRVMPVGQTTIARRWLCSATLTSIAFSTRVGSIVVVFGTVVAVESSLPQPANTSTAATTTPTRPAGAERIIGVTLRALGHRVQRQPGEHGVGRDHDAVDIAGAGEAQRRAVGGEDARLHRDAGIRQYARFGADGRRGLAEDTGLVADRARDVRGRRRGDRRRRAADVGAGQRGHERDRGRRRDERHRAHERATEAGHRAGRALRAGSAVDAVGAGRTLRTLRAGRAVGTGRTLRTLRAVETVDARDSLCPRCAVGAGNAVEAGGTGGAGQALEALRALLTLLALVTLLTLRPFEAARTDLAGDAAQTLRTRVTRRASYAGIARVALRSLRPRLAADAA